jgi:hypothetical protein
MSDRAKPCPICKEMPDETSSEEGWILFCCKFHATAPSYSDAVNAWNISVASLVPTVRVKPLVWEQMRDGAGTLYDVYSARCPIFEKRFWAEGKDKISGVEARRAARIMKVIEVTHE